MKQLLLTILILIGTAALAQTDTLDSLAISGSKQKAVRFKTNLRAFYIRPDGIGDNYISKGYKGRFGLGLKIDFFEAYNFQLGTGGEFLSYKTVNSAYGGDAGVFINNFYAEVMYKLPVTERFIIYPKATAGMNLIQYRTSGDTGSQNGHRFGFGAYLDYRITNRLEVFAGTDYSLTYPGVKTHPDYEEFFGKVKQVNFSAGLKVNIRD